MIRHAHIIALLLSGVGCGAQISGSDSDLDSEELKRRPGATANRAPEISVSCQTATLGQPSTINIEPIDYDGRIVSTYWTFGDGAIRDDRNFVWDLAHAISQHTYAAAGNYTVKVTATDNGGAQVTGTAVCYVTAPVNRAPEISVSCQTATLGQPSTINIEPIDYDGRIVSTYWTFGDGAIRDDRNFVWDLAHAISQHTYAAAGNYTVKVTATDNGGAQVTGTAVCYVTAPVNRAPEISVSCQTATLGQPSTINIEPIDYDGRIVSTYWTFGDGAIRDDRNFVWDLAHAISQHTYAAAGNYTVKVTATDNGGAQVTGTAVCYVN